MSVSESESSSPLTLPSGAELLLTLLNAAHVQSARFGHLEQFVVLIDRIFEIGEHFHFNALQFLYARAHLIQLTLGFHAPLLLLLLHLHLPQLLVKELRLVQVFLLQTDNFSLLEIGGQFLLFVHVNLLLELLFASSLLFSLGFEGDHLLIRLLQLQCLLLLALLLGHIQALLQLFLAPLLRLDSMLQMAYLTLLNLLEPYRIVSRLLNLSHELVLLLGQVVHPRHHLLLVLFRLVVLLAGDALRAFRPSRIVVALLLLRKSDARHADLRARPQ